MAVSSQNWMFVLSRWVLKKMTFKTSLLCPLIRSFTVTIVIRALRPCLKNKSNYRCPLDTVQWRGSTVGKQAHLKLEKLCTDNQTLRDKAASMEKELSLVKEQLEGSKHKLTIIVNFEIVRKLNSLQHCVIKKSSTSDSSNCLATTINFERIGKLENKNGDLESSLKQSNEQLAEAQTKLQQFSDAITSIN